ncbi:alpha/beta hydrolase fold protein, partial [mine drainage metagenome]
AENPNYREEMVKRAVQINPNETVLRKMLSADNEDAYLTPSNLGRINAKTLIIWGRNDTTVRLEYSRVFNRSIRKSKLIVLELDKHTPHYSNPEAVSKLLIDFIRN